MLTPHVDDRIAHTVLSLDAHVYVFTMVNANESQNKGKLPFIYAAFLYVWFHMSKQFPCSGPISAFYITATWRGGRGLSANELVRVGCEQHGLILSLSYHCLKEWITRTRPSLGWWINRFTLVLHSAKIADILQSVTQVQTTDDIIS